MHARTVVGCALDDRAGDDAGFIAAGVAAPIVQQTPMPDREWCDGRARVDGPMSDLQDALSQRLITADLCDKRLTAMKNAGYEA